MREILSSLLVSTLVFQVGPVAAHDSDRKAAAEADPPVALAERFGNMSGEAERFFKSKNEGAFAWAHDQEGLARSGVTQANVADRIRAKVLDTPIGTEITITLRDGEVVQGELAEVAESYLRLRVLASEEARRTHGDRTTIRRKFSFEEVRTLLVGPDPRDIAPGKKVEVRLVGGDKVRGRLTAVGDDGVTVDNRRFTFDEIIGVRKLGMPTVYKVLIGVGAVLGTLVILCGTHGWCSG